MSVTEPRTVVPLVGAVIATTGAVVSRAGVGLGLGVGPSPRSQAPQSTSAISAWPATLGWNQSTVVESLSSPTGVADNAPPSHTQRFDVTEHAAARLLLNCDDRSAAAATDAEYAVPVSATPVSASTPLVALQTPAWAHTSAPGVGFTTFHSAATLGSEETSTVAVGHAAESERMIPVAEEAKLAADVIAYPSAALASSVSEQRSFPPIRRVTTSGCSPAATAAEIRDVTPLMRLPDFA